jgi:UDP-N-acetylglucosamine 2-epimerase (non-hydrolysing)
MGTRLVHVGAGTRSRVNGDDVNAILIDRLSDGFYAQDNSAYLNLIREGVDESRVHLVGPLLVDATKLAEAEPMAPARVLQLSGALASLADDEGGYGMVFLEKTLLQGSRDAITMLLSSLHQLAREATLVWPVPAAVEARLAELGLREQLHHERLSVVAPVTFAQSVALLKGAAMVVTDCPDVRLQAGALGVRCLMVDMRNDLSLGAPKGGMPLDGQSGRRIAEHLGPWLSQESASALTH